MGAQVQMINLQMRGTNGSPPQEEWQTGIWMGRYGSNIVISEVNLFTYINDCLTAFTDFWTSIRPFCSIGTDWTSVRAYGYEIGSNNAAAIWETPVEAAAGSSATTHPFSVGMAVTTRSGVQTRSGRGRMYLPTNGLAVAPETGLYIGSAPTVGGLVRDLIDDLNAVSYLGTGELRAGVYSRSQSLHRTITQTSADLRPDTQRRRDVDLASPTTFFPVAP